MKKLYSLVYAIPLLAAPLSGTPPSPLLKKQEDGNIVINNRILAKVNGKAISVVDLIKKMDLLFYREYPQFSAIPEARYQFYQASWKHVLNEMVDKELILADAEEHKIPASAGEVRQEMENLFGPNIIANLDKVNMTFDEAWNIVRNDILIQRMIFLQVNAKVLQNVTPKDVRNAYSEYAENNIKPDSWVYQVIALRSAESAAAASAAEIAYNSLAHDEITPAELREKLALDPAIAASCKITATEELRHNSSEISTAYREQLDKLEPGKYSEPIPQRSRNSGDMAYRIFWLKEFTPGGPPAYNDVANELKEQLYRQAQASETEAYLQRLRKHFDIQEMAPEGFLPFTFQ